jgi:hypothetical protein
MGNACTDLRSQPFMQLHSRRDVRVRGLVPSHFARTQTMGDQRRGKPLENRMFLKSVDCLPQFSLERKAHV